MSYLGKFTKEELERLKRRSCEPTIDEELGIKLTYVEQLKPLGEKDELFQSFIFNYNDDNDEKKIGKGRSR